MRRTKLYNIWISVQTSFWFIPSLMIVAAFWLSFLMVGADFYIYDHHALESARQTGSRLFSLAYTIDPSGARSVLSTIAGSMITVAGVTFSITIVVLTLAASQFGPRLLRNFMEDKHTQYVLGIFSATFLYCLIVLRAVQSGRENSFSPVLSVNLAIVLAVIDVFVLIYFIHHIAVSIKAEHVIQRIYANLEHHINRIFMNDPANGDTGKEKLDADPHKRVPARYTLDIKADGNGYLQAIDYDRLMALGIEGQCCITLHLKAGDFATAATVLMTVRSEALIEEDSSLRQHFKGTCILGPQRTPEQDVEFEIRQLVEVAVRSLSPGINDPFTAASCVDYLGAALSLLSQRRFPADRCLDTDGIVRIIRRPVSFGDISDAAFNQIRQHSRTSPAVTMRLMEAYTAVAAATEDGDIIKELIRHAAMLKRSGFDALKADEDKQDLADRYERFLKTVDKLPDA